MQLNEDVVLTLGVNDFAVQNDQLISRHDVIFATAAWKMSMDNANQDETASASGATAEMIDMTITPPNKGILSYIQYAYSHLYFISYTYRSTNI